jgi:hypothetical protein
MNKENIFNFTMPDGTEALTVLHGDAATQYNDVPINISGTITAPHNFIKNKVECYDVKEAHILADRDAGTIDLVLRDHNPNTLSTIKGRVMFSKLFQEIGINKKNYTIESMRNFFTMRPQYFKDQEERRKILRKLFDFKAQFSTKVENMQELTTGKRKLMLEKELAGELDIVKKFTLQVPILAGSDPSNVDIELYLTIHNDELNIMMYSDALILKMEKIVVDTIQKQLENIQAIFACSQVFIG